MTMFKQFKNYSDSEISKRLTQQKEHFSQNYQKFCEIIEIPMKNDDEDVLMGLINKSFLIRELSLEQTSRVLKKSFTLKGMSKVQQSQKAILWLI